MEYQWVIGAYTGEQAKVIKAHTDVGIGYFFQREGGRGATYTVYAAFRRPIDSYLPDNLELCNQFQVQKLNQLWAKRQGRDTAPSQVAAGASL